MAFCVKVILYTLKFTGLRQVLLFKSDNLRLTLFLLMTTHESFVDNVDQDQTAQNVQSDL